MSTGELRHKLRMIISHASGGILSEPEDVDRSVNDICVQISAHKNDIWKQAQESALRERTPASTGERDELVERLRTGAANLRGAALFYDESRDLDEAADAIESLTRPGLKEALEEIERRIVAHRKTMNDDKNEPALRYMASGAFEAMRELRQALASVGG